MALTYEPLATTTTGSDTNTVSFGSISGSYTDLVLVGFLRKATSGADYMALRFNSDTGTNYNRVRMTMSTSATATYAESSIDSAIFDINVNATNQGHFICHIQSYSNTTTWKQVLTRSNNTSTGVCICLNTWRSTSAINNVEVRCPSNFISGSVFTLYGIKAA